MEYCIELLLEHCEESWFQSPHPIETAWGPGLRVDEVNKLLWSNALHVIPFTPTPGLLQNLPVHMQHDWYGLSVDGNGMALSELEDLVNSNIEAEDLQQAVKQNELLQLLRFVLSQQRRWAAFFLYNCDDLAVVQEQSVEELCQGVMEAYSWDGAKPRGFCSWGDTMITDRSNKV